VKFSVVIWGRGVHPHVACFEEVARALSSSLRELGHETVEPGDGGRYIIFGTNNGILVEDTKHPVPDDAIIFNTEQMTFFDGNVRVQMQSFDRWKKHVIWDYSQENIRRLRAEGATKLVHCPIGYHPRMEFLGAAEKQDIDVLFYGSVNPRRREVLEALDAAGMKVVVLFGAYGKERDDAISRAKIVLNMHAMDDAIWEIFRVSHLLANKKCVVSENGGKDPELEDFAKATTLYVSKDEIVGACRTLLEMDAVRQLTANSGYETFKKTSFVDNVKKALEQS
jgi:hypothetical protein